MTRMIHRRDAIRAGLAALSAPLPAFGAEAGGVRMLTLAEPAGLRREAEPVSTPVPDVEAGRHFRLVRDGRAIPAQFRPVDGPGGRRGVVLDFAADLGPAESARYQVEFGPEVTPGPEPKDGLTLTRSGGAFRIARNRVEAFTLAEDLAHFLRSAGSPRLPYVRDGSPGLSLTLAGGETRRPGKGGPTVAATIVREGPFAIGLRYAWSDAPDLRSVLDLTIPLTRDRVEASWAVQDPGGRLESLDLALTLDLDRASFRVELGAGESPPRGDGAELIVEATAGPRNPHEGWLRASDARRQVVAAVADFGRSSSRDRIAVSGDGLLTISRRFATPTTHPRQLRFWLAFAPAAPFDGRTPSPRAILDPIQIAWDRPPAP